MFKPRNKIVTFKAANNALASIDSKFIKRIRKAQVIDFTANSRLRFYSDDFQIAFDPLYPDKTDWKLTLQISLSNLRQLEQNVSSNFNPPVSFCSQLATSTSN
jgi:hypothetical protein